MNWESICSKYEQIQEIIIESYPKTSEESKDFPNLKSCNCIVFFTVHVSSLIKRLIPYWYDIAFTLAKLYRKSLRCSNCFVMYHLEKRIVSTAIRYKMCAQIFVLSANKSSIRYAFRKATKSCSVKDKLRHVLLLAPVE